MTTPPDAEAVARAKVMRQLVQYLDTMGNNAVNDPYFHEALDAYREAVERRVRAECAAKVRAARWSEHSPFCDKSGVSGCCGMAARNAAVSDILADLEAQP